MNMSATTTTIVEEIVSKAKQGTTTYGEALNNLHHAMMQTPHAKWHHYEAALSQLNNEMRNQPHGIDPNKLLD